MAIPLLATHSHSRFDAYAGEYSRSVGASSGEMQFYFVIEYTFFIRNEC